MIPLCVDDPMPHVVVIVISRSAKNASNLKFCKFPPTLCVPEGSFYWFIGFSSLWYFPRQNNETVKIRFVDLGDRVSRTDDSHGNRINNGGLSCETA